jgi:hypothetical protein
MRHLLILGLVVLVTFAVAAGACAQPTISASVLANGAERLAGPANILIGTVGQASIGNPTGLANRHGAGFWYRVGGILTPVDGELPGISADPWLGPGAPNPFNPLTTIHFATAAQGRVALRLYDLAGRQIRVLVDEDLPAGIHEAVLDGTGLASGVYVCRMTTGGFMQTRKLMLVK